MARHLIPNPGPYIETALTERFLSRLDRIAHRRPEVAALVVAIRNGDNDRLHDLIRQAQAGDGDAALTAIVALLPRLCKVILRRMPTHLWRSSIDDYLTIAYLTIADIAPTESPAFLSDKIVARTRRRHERQQTDPPFVPLAYLERADEECPTVEESAIARLELERLSDALHSGDVRSDDWAQVTAAAFGKKPAQARSDAERQHLVRIRRRLAAMVWIREAA